MQWVGQMGWSPWHQWKGGLALYVATPLTATHRFDPLTGQWCEVAPLLSKRKHLGVAVHHNVIYAVGGRDQHTELNSVERSGFKH